MTRNDITGDKIKSRATTDKYRSQYDKIFGKSKNAVQKSKDKKENAQASSKEDS